MRLLVLSPVLYGKYLQDEVVSSDALGVEPETRRLLAIGAVRPLSADEDYPNRGTVVRTFVVPTTIEEFAWWLASITGTPDLCPAAYRPDKGWHEFPVADGKVHVARAGPKACKTPFGYHCIALHSGYWNVTTVSAGDLQKCEPISFRMISLGEPRIKVQARCGVRALMGYFEELLTKVAIRWPDPHLSRTGDPPHESEHRRPMDKIKVLFLSANPADRDQLAFDEEVREITAKIRAAEHRDDLELVTCWAVRPDDLLQAFNQHKPQIVHFSGHGSDSDEIFLLDRAGRSKPIAKAALVNLFRALKGNIRVVVLNACFSRSQADAIREIVDCTIGMNDEIGDEAAISFAASFYRAIGFGCSVGQAFEQGKAALMLEGIPEEHIPELLVRPGVDAFDVILLGASSRP
jgi:hypothetical protein